jgi:pyruvate oxidase
VVLDNSMLGKISKEQRAAELDVWQTDLVNPDFAAYAELCGARGVAVDHARDLDPAFETMFATEGPVTVRVRTDPELV